MRVPPGRFERLVFGLVLMAMLQSCSASSPADNTVDLGNGLYLFQFAGQQSLFLVGDEGVIVTDPLSREAAAEYRRAVRALTDKPVKYVVYTNSFFDRVPGAGVFTADGATVVAQENCKANLEATPHPDAVLPEQTYSDSTGLDVGGASLSLHYFGQSYGTCLSVVVVEPANVLFAHNLIQPQQARLPEDPTLANYYLHNIVPFFVSVEALAASTGVQQVVGSEVVGEANGAGDQLAPVTLITEQRVFWDSLLRVVETEYNKGTPAQVIPRKADMTSLEGFAGYDPERAGIMMRRVYSLYRIGR